MASLSRVKHFTTEPQRSLKHDHDRFLFSPFIEHLRIECATNTQASLLIFAFQPLKACLSGPVEKLEDQLNLGIVCPVDNIGLDKQKISA